MTFIQWPEGAQQLSPAHTHTLVDTGMPPLLSLTHTGPHAVLGGPGVARGLTRCRGGPWRHLVAEGADDLEHVGDERQRRVRLREEGHHLARVGLDADRVEAGHDEAL